MLDNEQESFDPAWLENKIAGLNTALEEKCMFLYYNITNKRFTPQQHSFTNLNYANSKVTLYGQIITGLKFSQLLK